MLTYMVFVRGLVGACEGMKPMDSASGTDVLSLLDLIFFYCMRRCPILVDNAFVRCLKMRDIASPVQDTTWNFLTARRKVAVVGMNMQ